METDKRIAFANKGAYAVTCIVSSVLVALMCHIALRLTPFVGGWVTEHVHYVTGDPIHFPATGFLALGLSVLSTLTIRQEGVWFAEIGPAMAILGILFALYGPHCEIDLLIFAAWLLACWGLCKPDPKRVATLMVVIIIIAWIMPSPFGTPMLF